VTATVDNISLIASSIMSKKIASGADVIVLDVKTGTGAFMKTPEASAELARMMVTIGNNCGRTTYAVITDMNQVLGRYVGNWLEVREAMEVLSGKGDPELTLVSVILAAYMLLGCGVASTLAEAKEMAKDALTSGKAFAKFREFVSRQGGDPNAIDRPETRGKCALEIPVCASRGGFVGSVNAEEIGIASLLLGGGREKKDDPIDPLVGIRVDKKVGDPVACGEQIGVLYANDAEKAKAAEERFRGAYTYSDTPVAPIAPIYGYVDATGVHT